MSRPGTKGVPRERREEQILDIATTEFGERGYAKASVAEIASAAGVSKPLVYAYFGSRDGLHAACVHRAGQGLVDAVAAAQSARGAHDRALATLTGIFRALDGRTQNWKIVYDPTLPRASAAHTVARHYQDALNGMGSAGVSEVLADAGITDPDDHSLLLALWFSVVSTTISWWSDHPGHTPEDMTRRCLRLFTTIRATAAPRT
ncbi:TetR/AcrR family transcriptional regulator [Nocardia implantans]|uniref:TetR/AcrR family transcriptional regulator n=1 Tax=Nocardia implantans TaxID=3108168 RepID=A0ABU6ASD6_9NOCA|nr:MULTISPECIES: TetR/AcrR family transcriptional regulator [unclassified Nocardia]MBF6191766.1 TetR/AcrR family transcriptional regulator [Nocardia beijingensis]MEA3527923.1 TetR/AcrR family transcriptional regulator [Nocardia sp. CDC192]MEB3510325.1 TetR/AcrR family transcriptional regulator [Nocardia sp. CDC186]